MNRKKKLSIIGVSLFVLIFCFLLNSCVEKPIPIPGWDQLYLLKIDSLEHLKIIYGKGFLYSTNEIYDAEVHSLPPDTLYYKKDKIEYMPELQSMKWSEEFADYTVLANVNKGGIHMPDDENKLTKIGNYDVYLFDTETPAFSESEKYVGAMFIFENGGYFFTIDYPDDIPLEGAERAETIDEVKQILSEYILQLQFYEVSK